MKMAIDVNPFSMQQGVLVYNEEIEDFNDSVIEINYVANEKLIETIKNLGIKHNVHSFVFYGNLDYCAKLKNDLFDSFDLTNYSDVEIILKLDN